MKTCSKTLLLLLSLLLVIPTSAQTFIGPVLGLHFAHIEGYDTKTLPFNNITTGPGFGIKSPFAGIRIDQYLNGRLFVSVTSGFTQKTVKYSDTGFVGYTNVRFNQLDHTLTLNMCPVKNWHIGFGGHFSHLFTFEIGKKRVDYWGSLGRDFNVQLLGWVFSTSFTWKGFLFDARFYQSERTFATFDRFVKSTSAIEMGMTYRFKVFEKRKRSVITLPLKSQTSLSTCKIGQ